MSSCREAGHVVGGLDRAKPLGFAVQNPTTSGMAYPGRRTSRIQPLNLQIAQTELPADNAVASNRDGWLHRQGWLYTVCIGPKFYLKHEDHLLNQRDLSLIQALFAPVVGAVFQSLRPEPNVRVALLTVCSGHGRIHHRVQAEISRL